MHARTRRCKGRREIQFNQQLFAALRLCVVPFSAAVLVLVKNMEEQRTQRNTIHSTAFSPLRPCVNQNVTPGSSHPQKGNASRNVARKQIHGNMDKIRKADRPSAH